MTQTKTPPIPLTLFEIAGWTALINAMDIIGDHCDTKKQAKAAFRQDAVSAYVDDRRDDIFEALLRDCHQIGMSPKQYADCIMNGEFDQIQFA